MAVTAPGSPYVESSDLVANYPGVSESLAERVDLVGVLPFADSTARGTALPSPTDGQYSYLQDTNATEYYNGSAWVAAGGGKVLQVVRATDTTNRTTTSSSAADTGLSVTITPTSATSLILLISNCQARTSGSAVYGSVSITNSANTPISGAERVNMGFSSGGIGLAGQMLIGYDSPATTSATTYKLRFYTNAGNFQILNADMTGQLYAIEVSA